MNCFSPEQLAHIIALDLQAIAERKTASGPQILSGKEIAEAILLEDTPSEIACKSFVLAISRDQRAFLLALGNRGRLTHSYDSPTEEAFHWAKSSLADDVPYICGYFGNGYFTKAIEQLNKVAKDCDASV